MKINDVVTTSLIAGLWLGLGSACQKQEGGAASKDGPITGRASDPPVMLKAEWQPGQRYTLHLESSQTSTMPFGRQPTTQEAVFMQDYGLAVSNALGGGRGLDLEIQALVVQVQMGDREVIRFDSLNKVTPNEGPGVENLQRVIGGHLRFLLDANNAVVKTDGLQELIDRAQGDTGGRGGNPRRNFMGGFVQQVYNVEYFKQMIDLSTLPGKAVRIGDTWTRQQNFDVGMAGRVVASITNTLRGWQQHDGRKCARIEFQGAVGLKTGPAGGTPGPGLFSVEDGRVTGQCWFDPALGLPVDTAVEQSGVIKGMRPAFGRRNNPGATNNAPQPFSSPWKQTINFKVEQVPADAPASTKG